MGRLIEWATQAIQCISIAHIYRPTPLEVQGVNILRPAEQPVELDCSCRPTCYVSGEIFQQRQGALAPAMEDRVGDIAAWNEDFITQPFLDSEHVAWFYGLVDSLVTNQIANIGNHPVLASFDEPVLVELGNIILNDIYLLGDDPQQCLERPTLFRVTLAVDSWQELIQTIRIFIHRGNSVIMSVSGTSGLKNAS